MLIISIQAVKYIKAGQMAEGTQPVRKFKIPAVMLCDGWLWGRNNGNPTVEGSHTVVLNGS